MDILQKLSQKENLTIAEAQRVMEGMISGRYAPSQTAALLVALKMKGESEEELEGFVRVMRSAAISISPKADGLTDTCGTGGDGRSTFNISTTAAFIAAGAGVPIAKHGNRSVSSSCGSADVLEELGVKMLPPPEVEQCIERIGIGFMFAPLFHPAMKNVAPVRKELGIRTVFNLLGPLVNPAQAQRQVVGVYDPAVAPKMAHVLAALGTRHAMVVHSEGMDEIGLGITDIVEVKNGSVESCRLDARELGLKPQVIPTAKSKMESAAIIRAVLAGKPGAARDVALLNAAAAIYVGGRAGTIGEGLEKATASIDAGHAQAKLEQLVAFRPVRGERGEPDGHSG